MRVEFLNRQETFRVLKRLLNFASHKLQVAEVKHDTFLDYYLCESHLECHRGFLRIDDFFTKVLTLKEPSAQSFPLIFQKLLEVQANFFIATEWKKEEPDKTRSRIHSRRRHFHNTKRSFVSYLNTSDAPATAQDMEPRAYSSAPIGTNFIAVGAGNARGALLFDPALPIEDAQAT